MTNKMIAQFKEYCKGCIGFRIITKYDNGLIRKAVYSPYNIKCKHKWRFNLQEVMKVIRESKLKQRRKR